MKLVVKLYWYGQLSWTQPSGIYLCVCVCVFPSEVTTPLFGVTSSNVELRNYLISRQNNIIIKSSYVIR